MPNTAPITMDTNSIQSVLTPEIAYDVLVKPLPTESVAGRVSTPHHTTNNETHFPRVLADPNSEWLKEGDEINPAAAQMGTVVVTPAKVGGLTVLTNESLQDSSIDLGQLVGAGLVRDISKKVDAAFFGNLPAPAPSGLEALEDVATVSAGTSWANLDPFEEAINAAETLGATLNSFVAHPDDMLALSTLKRATGSNESLLSDNATTPGARVISGVALIPSAHVTPGTVWGLPKDRIMMVIRRDAQLNLSDGPFFTSDRTAVRATMRVGFGFIEPESIVKITIN